MEEFLKREKAIDEANMLGNAEFVGERDETFTVTLAFVAPERWVRCADDEIEDFGMLLHQFGHRLYCRIDTLAWPEQAKCHEQGSIGKLKIVLRHRGIDESSIRRTMWHQRYSLGGYSIDVLQDALPSFSHDYKARRAHDDLIHDTALCIVRRCQDGVKSCHDRRADPAQKFKNMTSGFAAKYSEFVLQRHDIDIGDIQEVGGNSI